MTRSDWKRIAAYGALLAAGTLLLEWIDYQRLARARAADLYLLLGAVLFLALGIYLGVRLFRPAAAAPAPFDGNPRAREALGLTPAESAVLAHLASGLSNKEIAARLEVSPNTVKTHLARVFDKLGARRRTEAILRARELGLLP